MSRWHRDNPELYDELGDDGYVDLLHERADAARDELCDAGPEGCGACGGPLTMIGTLGRRLHLRCRDCGLDQSRLA